MKVDKPTTKAGQVWLVFCEARVMAVTISAQNDGFWVGGQEPLWNFDCIRTWFKCLYDPETEERVMVGLVPD
jgi:hypothetical protein